MATMNIKDPEVHRMAKELAEIRHTSVTGAVRDALRAALDEERRRNDDREDLVEFLMDLGRRSAAKPEPFLTDDDLYDEMGLPK